MKKKSSDIELHSAGATIRHQSVFEDLNSYRNEEDLSQEFLDKWVVPFYFNLKNQDEGWIKKMISLRHQTTDEVILKNLGDFNWRTRSTGAYFASGSKKVDKSVIYKDTSRTLRNV